MFLRLLPAVLSLVILGAHFLRLGNLVVVALLIACIGLLRARRPWAAYSVQTILAMGIVVWILTGYGIALVRIQNGEPWIRMAVILGAVAVMTLYAILSFRHPRTRAWFGTDQPGAGDQPTVEPS
jgi:hypothetical protein